MVKVIWEVLGGHLYFMWETPESVLFHSNYTCHSLFLRSIPLHSLLVHFVSSVSSECFITNMKGLGGQLLESTHQLLMFSAKVIPFFCHLYVTRKASQSLPFSQWKHLLSTVNDCYPPAELYVNNKYMYIICQRATVINSLPILK